MSITNSKQIGDVKVLLKTGIDGSSIESIEKTETIGLVDVYTITLTNGEKSTFEVTNGNGIVSVEKTGTSGLVDTYTITFEDGSTTTFQITNGADTNAQIAERVENPATKDYAIGDYVVFANALYKVIAPIASGSDFIIDTNLKATEVMDEVKDRDEYIKANTKLIKETVGWIGKNKLNSNATTTGHVTVNADFTMDVNGTVSAQENIPIADEYEYMLPKGDYILSSGLGVANANVYITVEGYNNNSWVKSIASTSTGDKKPFTLDYNGYNKAYVSAHVKAGTYDHVILEPMIVESGIIDFTYEVYRGVTAFPRDEQKILGAKNLLDVNKFIASSFTVTDNEQNILESNITDSKTYFDCIIQTYNDTTFVANVAQLSISQIGFYELEFEVVSPANRIKFGHNGSQHDIKFTYPIGIGKYIISFNATSVNASVKIELENVMIRLATDTDSSYAPYAKTNKELTDDVDTLDTAKQPKTLDNPITIGGESRTTVETALGALNNVMNNDRIIGKNVSINTSYGVGYPKYYKIFEVNISGNSNAIPLRITGEIGNKDQWTNATFDITVDIHSTYGGYIYGNVIGKDLYGYFPSLLVTIQSSTIRVYVYMGYSGAYFKANVFADVGTVYTNPTGEDSYAGTVKSRLSELIASDLGSAKLTWLDSQSTYFDEASHKCKIYRYDNTRFMCVIDVQQNMSTHNTYQPFIRFDPVLLPAEFKNRYEYEDVSGSKFDLLINENGRAYINGLETGHIFLTLIF